MKAESIVRSSLDDGNCDTSTRSWQSTKRSIALGAGFANGLAASSHTSLKLINLYSQF